MPNIILTDAEAALLIELLELALDSFANHGCNDFDLAAIVPALSDRRALMKAYNDYNKSPGDFAYDEEQGSQFEMTNDAAMIGYLAHRVREQSSATVENELEKASKGKAYYMRQCDKQVDRIADLEELVISWQGFAEEIADEYGDEFEDDRKKLVQKTAQLLGEDQ